jgi:hypothetical protein
MRIMKLCYDDADPRPSFLHARPLFSPEMTTASSASYVKFPRLFPGVTV